MIRVQMKYSTTPLFIHISNVCTSTIYSYRYTDYGKSCSDTSEYTYIQYEYTHSSNPVMLPDIYWEINKFLVSHRNK